MQRLDLLLLLRPLHAAARRAHHTWRARPEQVGVTEPHLTSAWHRVARRLAAAAAASAAASAANAAARRGRLYDVVAGHGESLTRVRGTDEQHAEHTAERNGVLHSEPAAGRAPALASHRPRAESPAPSLRSSAVPIRFSSGAEQQRQRSSQSKPARCWFGPKGRTATPSAAGKGCSGARQAQTRRWCSRSTR